MKRASLEDYLEQGMYGPKQIKPDERKKFLGTLRERVVIALTKGQVMEPGIYPQVAEQMKEHPGTTLLLNGSISYSFLSDYIQAAKQAGIPFSIVSRNGSHTNLGLVLASPDAIDLENIYIEKTEKAGSGQSKKKKKSLLKKLLRKK